MRRPDDGGGGQNGDQRNDAQPRSGRVRDREGDVEIFPQGNDARHGDKCGKENAAGINQIDEERKGDKTGNPTF